MTQHLYLSPHLDDAVLSCGGLMARQAGRGEAVTVLTPFAGNPPPGALSPLARELHARWEAFEDPVALRRAEDHAACQILGVSALHLSFPESLYRTGPVGEPLYATEESLFGPPHPREEALVQALRDRLARETPPEARAYCPLALGGHVDHRLLRRAAEGLRRPLWYYPDLPYAARGGGLPPGLDEPAAEAVVYPLTSDELRAWVRAAAAYRSQLSTFWPDVAGLERELRGYHETAGGLRLLRPGSSRV